MKSTMNKELKQFWITEGTLLGWYYGYQTYRFGPYCTDIQDFVQLTDQAFICTLKCTDFIVLLKIYFLFLFTIKM
jgi:hypothetical protein